ncbi:uncharacterized protein DS421_20g694290 [Arachis hypogaea]|nr:uncharacterized protein DS421_20g694290 [Arachis hypogaea]
MLENLNCMCKKSISLVKSKIFTKFVENMCIVHDHFFIFGNFFYYKMSNFHFSLKCTMHHSIIRVKKKKCTLYKNGAILVIANDLEHQWLMLLLLKLKKG